MDVMKIVTISIDKANVIRIMSLIQWIAIFRILISQENF